MSVSSAVIPPALDPLLDQGGTLTTPWRRFLEALWNRSGKFQEISVTATTNTNLQFSYTGSDGVVRKGNLTLS